MSAVGSPGVTINWRSAVRCFVMLVVFLLPMKSEM